MTSNLRKFRAWFFEGMKKKEAHGKPDHWWKVMCLTGTDYFSSMGFQPGIAFTAAGYLAPLATFNLVLLTLFGALPTYLLVAKESPHGQGSFAIFERLLTGWVGKTLVLILLGFAATDFIFTITMCAADATAHIVENPLCRGFITNRLITTLVLIGSLGLIFLKGFGEAVKISFLLVIYYLVVNLIVLAICLSKIAGDPTVIQNWLDKLFTQHTSYLEMFKTAAIVFPQLALGMSGFETGVAVMPLVAPTTKKSEEEEALEKFAAKGDAPVEIAGAPGVPSDMPKDDDENNEDGEDDDEHKESEAHCKLAIEEALAGRVHNTRKLLITVAIVMSIFLLIGCFATTVLIPAELFAKHGPADGRALAYLAHLYLGDSFGTIYDLATILILWFAGASGMAALLSLVPQYLPRYGMAPDWAKARRPLVVFFTLVSALITVVFNAEVEAQAGAFATGLLVMITSAAIAVTALVWKKNLWLRIGFSLISLVFVYASIAVTHERPDGIVISLFFIGAILITSFLSRAMRSTELRIGDVQLDEKAQSFIESSCKRNMGIVRILAHRPGGHDYKIKEQEARTTHSIQNEEGDFIFFEVTLTDVSEFMDEHLDIKGVKKGPYRVLRCASPSAPNAIAALLLHIRDTTGKMPHAYFEWTEGNPLFYVMKYIILGEGETAPLTREILRIAESDPEKRPKVHVG